MRPEQKTKSRSKLYAALEGGKEIVGAAGLNASGAIKFADNPAENETVTIGTTTFTFKATPVGENQVDIGIDLSTSIDNLIAAVLAHSVTGAWGFLHPIDAVSATKTDTNTEITLVFWPGAWANGITLTGSVGDETITASTGGVNAPSISPDVNLNVIDTTGASANQEYYILADGKLGQKARVLVKTFAAGTTPSILGHLKEDGVAMVECEFITGEPGAYIEFMWDGEAWSQTSTSALNTQPDFTAA
jgi:hypothetical protein